jgi:hypothetical protein
VQRRFHPDAMTPHPRRRRAQVRMEAGLAYFLRREPRLWSGNGLPWEVALHRVLVLAPIQTRDATRPLSCEHGCSCLSPCWWFRTRQLFRGGTKMRGVAARAPPSNAPSIWGPDFVPTRNGRGSRRAPLGHFKTTSQERTRGGLCHAAWQRPDQRGAPLLLVNLRQSLARTLT